MSQGFYPAQEFDRFIVFSIQIFKMSKKSWYKVDKNLLPIKAHYFFFFGAMGGVVPFMPVLAKGLGISATAVGLVYTALPFCVFLSKPLFGYVTDRLRDIRVVLLLLACVTCAAYSCVLPVPAIPSPAQPWRPAQVGCPGHSAGMLVVAAFGNGSGCVDEALAPNASAVIRYLPCNAIAEETVRGTVARGGDSEFSERLVLVFIPDSGESCACVAANSSSALSCPALEAACAGDSHLSSVYGTYQFWVFTLLAVVSGTGAATVFCLTDAACYEVLEDRPALYGRQRLWATISWGAVTLLAGFCNDLASARKGSLDYSPGFYIMVSLVLVDVLLLLRMRLPKAHISVDICRDVGRIFSSCQTVTFALAVYVAGALTGLVWNYQFWFLEELGASQTLMGLCVAVQCLVAEVPFFFFAGYLIRKFGHFNCLAGSFAAFALRLSLYYVLVNPWLVLPVEALHGLTFALFYAAMTGYASENAPPGAEATMMGILGGLFEGLGVATGSLLGGVGFDRLGGAKTFLVAGLVSLVCVPLLLVAYMVIRRIKPKSNDRGNAGCCSRTDDF